MTNAEPSKTQPPSAEPQARDLSLAGLVLSAAAAEIAADAEERDQSGSYSPLTSSVSGVRPRSRSVFVPRRREPARRPRATTASDPTSVPAQPTALVGAPDDAEEGSPPETRSELRDWIKDNAT